MPKKQPEHTLQTMFLPMLIVMISIVAMMVVGYYVIVGFDELQQRVVEERVRERRQQSGYQIPDEILRSLTTPDRGDYEYIIPEEILQNLTTPDRGDYVYEVPDEVLRNLGVEIN